MSSTAGATGMTASSRPPFAGVPGFWPLMTAASPWQTTTRLHDKARARLNHHGEVQYCPPVLPVTSTDTQAVYQVLRPICSSPRLSSLTVVALKGNAGPTVKLQDPASNIVQEVPAGVTAQQHTPLGAMPRPNRHPGTACCRHSCLRDKAVHPFVLAAITAPFPPRRPPHLEVPHRLPCRVLQLCQYQPSTLMVGAAVIPAVLVRDHHHDGVSSGCRDPLRVVPEWPYQLQSVLLLNSTTH